MSTPVVMPQMGESIAEGTIVRWIKKVGDPVDRDEPLLEISTDKVDAEVAAPAAGVLTEIAVQEGETVPVNSVVGTIGQPGDAAATADSPDREAEAAQSPSARPAAPGDDAGAGAPGTDDPLAIDELRLRKSSPLVRRMAREHGIDITQIRGSGTGGRVTKGDLLAHLDGGGGRAATPAPAASAGEADRVEVRPLSVMRRKIAEHMVLSRRTAAHVHSVFHVNCSTIERIRQQKRGDYERLGARLTYMTFIAKAVVDALRRHPVVNASLEGDNVVYRKDINLGIAVALESGLIVPVIRQADEKNLLGLSRAIHDVADRARRKQLTPDEVHGGTFTITNPGQLGSQFGLPIINQPQVAILGVGAIEKRPVVIDDAIAIRTMVYLTLGYDHRLIDGAVGDQFMSDIKNQLENFDSSQV